MSMNMNKIMNIGQSKIMEITPKIAAEMLKGNDHNRNLSMVSVNAIANAIERGEWKLNGSPIIIGISGKLLDGQHRLEGIIKAGKSIYSWVVTGIPDDVFPTLDIGRKRNNSDTLRIRGESNANALAATARLLYSYYVKTGTKFTWGGGSTLTPTQTEQVIADHPSIRSSVANAVHNNKDMRLMLTVSLSAALHYIFVNISPIEGQEFMDKIKTGASLEVGDPILALRRSLTLCQLETPRIRVHLVFKAWNAIVNNKEVRILRVSTNERFPILLTPPSSIDGFSFAKLKQVGS